MNKKSLLGLILFACVVISGMFLTTEVLIEQSIDSGTVHTQLSEDIRTNEKTTDTVSKDFVKKDVVKNEKVDSSIKQTVNLVTPTVKPTKAEEKASVIEEATAGFAFVTGPITNTDSEDDSVMTYTNSSLRPKLITDCSKVDYLSYIPKMKKDKELKSALNIKNPKLEIEAEAAILFDADTKKVLFYKNPVQAVFPASTLKLLTAIVALERCSIEEEVTIGDEITMIASDSTKAYLKEGERITLENLLEGMLLPSGNDAAYAVAAYVGRKSLNDPESTKEEAVAEFIRLMNEEAKKIGVKNSCFKTPDGYDAIGQYTTAYDMGLIGLAALQYDKILEISQKSRTSTTFASGENVTWNSTNKLVKRYSGEFYSPAIGLKTGTSSMAGRCLISAAREDDKSVVCVIMNSTAVGRWEDAIALMEYGLK